ncbi:MAG: Phosphoserine phosphatase ThrH [Alphaproteobacteria bacterium MarineAlpha9_Bin5]|nr:MAG: Phosphoserine phosphatase ThrH [Alphaproteobacteria bacterium MarineAlpha9_Bin6]PPR39915.1 MAG: Phosphoserine phosphatase ThrH [Alphaproteobacteria bacterium MarineAlpha9_Bin5]HIN91449.1 bifunctional phosphoserine phosphatase/homoserine phosphotransferase ThrH [Alphaproteobacteria bacterium]
MNLVCLDLESVLVPEIWIGLAERTGIDALRLTTRDNPDYHALMRGRMRLLDDHGLTISDLRMVVAEMVPLDGAVSFLERLRPQFQIVILSDAFYELVTPLMGFLGWPTLFCHRLEIEQGRIIGYRLRQEDSKRRAVSAFQGLNFKVIAAGDSHNDISMLTQADVGILFRPPDTMISDHPGFEVVNDHAVLGDAIEAAAKRLNKF